MPEQFDFSKTEDQKKFDELSKEEKDKVVEDAEEEAYGAKERSEGNKEATERELSPEVIEAIMEKVQDINKDGIAFSVIRDKYAERKNDYQQVLHNILSNGILGFEHIYNREANHTDFTREAWKEEIKKNKKGVVHFNIIGRSRLCGNRTITNIDESYYGPGGVGIIFNLNKFQEIEEEIFCEKKFPERINTYKAVVSKFYPDQRVKYRNSENRFNPESELGFTLSHRVAPRFFQGLVINDESPVVLKHLPSEYKNVPFKDIPKGIIAKNTKKTLDTLVLKSMRMAYWNRPLLFLPIYDAHGNLLWPKQMSYEEVKKFVEERGKKQEGGEEIHPNPPFIKEGTDS